MEELGIIAQAGFIQTISVMATVIGCALYIHRGMETDRKEFRDQVKAQSDRSDHLYEMFYELLRDKK